MKAVVCWQWGPPSVLAVEEIPSPVLTDGHVRIAVHAAGIGFQDVLMVAGKYQAKPAFPFSPGNEVAGEVIACAADVDTVSVGDRVLAILDHGGYAEEVVAPADSLVKLPDAVPAQMAAAMGMAYGTAYLALVDRAQIASGEVLFVRGAGGGVGLAAVDLGRAFGATVIAAASSQEKLAIAIAAGARHAIDTSAEDVRARLLQLTSGAGADVVFDPVGSDFKEHCLRCVAWQGRILIVGFAGGEIPTIPAHYVLNKFCSVVGVTWGRSYWAREKIRFAEVLRQLLEMCADQRIRPAVSGVYPLDAAASILESLASRRTGGRFVLACR